MEREKFSISFRTYLTIMCLDEKYKILVSSCQDMLKVIDGMDEPKSLRNLCKDFISGCLGIELMLESKDIDLSTIDAEMDALNNLAEHISLEICASHKEVFRYSQELYNMLCSYIKEFQFMNVNFSELEFTKVHRFELDMLLESKQLNNLEVQLVKIVYRNSFSSNIERKIGLLCLLEKVDSLAEIKNIKLIISLIFVEFYNSKIGENDPLIRKLVELEPKLKI